MAALLFFKATTAIFSVAAIYTGAQALLNPVGFARSFGLPLVAIGAKPVKTLNSKTKSHLRPHEPAKSYISLMGIRQLANGIILAVFACQGKWTEVATILVIIGILVAGIDGLHLSRAGKTLLGVYHAVPGALIAAYASFILFYYV